MKNITPSSSNSSSQENFVGSEDPCVRQRSVSYTIFFISSILIMFPVCVLILYLGLRQWWQQRLSSTAATTSHSNVFIYHLVVMELMGVVGCTLCCVGTQVGGMVYTVGVYFWNFPWYGEVLYHILTCAEHHLAVVHPITYLSLKTERGIRIRNICTGCVWLVSFILSGLTSTARTQIVVSINIFLIILAILVISFCSVSVLFVLIRSGPGENPRGRGGYDQSKLKAFYIVMVILGVVSLRMVSNIAWMVFFLKSETTCEEVYYLVWFNLPCTLILPLLFLQRSGLLICCMSSEN